MPWVASVLSTCRAEPSNLPDSFCFINSWYLLQTASLPGMTGETAPFLGPPPPPGPLGGEAAKKWRWFVNLRDRHSLPFETVSSSVKWGC